MMNELEGQWIGFQSITEAIDTTTPGGKLVFHIFGAWSSY
jgi:DNA invertase Pin-like site-specific DNA recombinase